MTETTLRTENLGRDFGPVRAVAGFLGPNGVGKTTTINVLLGLLKHTDGRTDVLGLDTWTAAGAVRARTRCPVVRQVELALLEEIDMPGHNRRDSKARDGEGG
jgi:ABC-type hemin transport system ATPase subunit